VLPGETLSVSTEDMVTTAVTGPVPLPLLLRGPLLLLLKLPGLLTALPARASSVDPDNAC
jgi:hypothetical protein